MDEAMEQESPELDTGSRCEDSMVQRKPGGRLEITLPWPPSTGSMWRIFRNRWVLSPKGREYRVAVEEQIETELEKQSFPQDQSSLLEVQACSFRQICPFRKDSCLSAFP